MAIQVQEAEEVKMNIDTVSATDADDNDDDAAPDADVDADDEVQAATPLHSAILPPPFPSHPPLHLFLSASFLASPLLPAPPFSLMLLFSSRSLLSFTLHRWTVTLTQFSKRRKGRKIELGIQGCLKRSLFPLSSSASISTDVCPSTRPTPIVII